MCLTAVDGDNVGGQFECRRWRIGLPTTTLDAVEDEAEDRLTSDINNLWKSYEKFIKFQVEIGVPPPTRARYPRA